MLRTIRAGRSPKVYVKVTPEINGWKWARIKHVADRPDVPEDFAPDEITLQDRPIGQQLGHGIPWRNWWGHSREINNDAAWARFTTYEADLFNNNGVGGQIDTTQNVSAECIDMGGNLFAYDAETSTHVRMVTYKYNMDTSILNPLTSNFYYHPEYYFYMCSISKSGIIRKVGAGIDEFAPRVAYGEKWIRKSEITKLPGRPATWGIYDVLAP
jgi:hypothetical protein